MEKLKNILKKASKLDKLSRFDDPRGWYSRITWIIINSGRFIRITIHEFFEDRLLLRAMALTFGTLLALIPLLAVLLSMFNLFGGSEWFMEILRPILLKNLAPGSGPMMAEKIESILLKGGATTAGSLGFLFLIFIVYGIFSAIESTFNSIWGLTTKAGGLHRLPTYWGLLTIIPILIGSSLAFTTYIRALPLVNRAVESVDFAEVLINKSLPVMMIMLGFFLLYRFLPTAKVSTMAAIVGTLVAGLLYEIVKYLFILYSGKLVRIDYIYGSLAIIPMLLIWVNLSWIVVLIGVEVSYVFQHFKSMQSTGANSILSRTQKDSLAYLILTQATLSFRGERKHVTMAEWSHRCGAPPQIVSEIIEKLRKGGLIANTGSGGNNIILRKDPSIIRITEINKILSGDSSGNWAWPDEESWLWLKKYFSNKEKILLNDNSAETLNDFVKRIAAL